MLEGVNEIARAVFPSQDDAYARLAALEADQENGKLRLYGWAVITKDEAGKTSVIKTTDGGPVGSIVGLIGGALLGVIWGPGGLLMGALLGGSIGAVVDVIRACVPLEAIDQAKVALEPSTVALLAEVDSRTESIRSDDDRSSFWPGRSGTAQNAPSH
jgi:uncharacterized membrane protein